jgi:hypothetical protein
MHKFPPLPELQFLVGKEIGQIVFDPHSVQFRWSNGGQITAYDRIEHTDEYGETHAYDCTAYTGPALLLHRLIQKRVTVLDVEPLCLTLGFEGGQLLRLETEEGPYECGTIQFTDDLADGWIVY